MKPLTVILILMALTINPVLGIDLVESRRLIIDDKALPWNTAPWDSEKVLTFGDYQYTVFWQGNAESPSSNNYKLSLARRNLNDDSVQVILFSETVYNGADSHRSTTLGLSADDGRLHLSYDHHANALNYRKSNTGFLTSPPTTISTSDFGSETSMVGTEENSVTYPTFFNLDDGSLMFYYRNGVSGSGLSYLNRYDSSSGNWTRVGTLFGTGGTYTDGAYSSTDRSVYPNDILVDAGGDIHITWTYREETDNYDQNSNHDIYYAYSEDDGVTWRNNAGTLIADLSSNNPITLTDTGIKVKSIARNSWLMNSEAMALDTGGQPHLVIQYSDAGSLTEQNIQFWHVWRDSSGNWQSQHVSEHDEKGSIALRRGVLLSDDNDRLIYLTWYHGAIGYWMSELSGGTWGDWSQQRLFMGVTGEGFRYDRRRWLNDEVLTFPLVGSDTSYQLVDMDLVSSRPAPIVLGAFSTNGNYDGWYVSNATSSVSAGLMNLTYSGTNAYFRKTGLTIDPHDYRYVLVRARNRDATTAQKLHFITSADGVWNEAKSLSGQGWVQDDDYYRWYVFDVAARNSAWQAGGSVTGIRISTPTATIGDELQVDEVLVSNTGVPPPSDQIVGEFNLIGETDRWEYLNSSATYTSSGTVDLTFSTADPYMRKSGLYLSARDYSYVKVRMKNLSSGTQGRIYFLTEADTTWNSAKSKVFTITPSDTVYRNYVIDMSTVTGWTGRITAIRLDPADNGSSGQSSSVDHILVSNDNATTADEPDRFTAGKASVNTQYLGVFDTSGDTEGWVSATINPQTVSNGYNHLAVWNTNPYIIKEGLSIDAAERGAIGIYMKNNSTSTVGRVFFITESDPVWDAAKSVTFATAANEPTFYRRIAVMSSNANWKGKVIGIRIDPADTGSPGTSFDIGHIYY